MNKKIIVGSVFVIFLALVGFFGYKRLSSPPLLTNHQALKNQTYRSPEYSFSIYIPEGWNYDTETGRGGKDGTDSLTVTLTHHFSNGSIRIPIYVSQKDWTSVKLEFSEDYKSEDIIETTLVGQPALIIALKGQYYFRIKHSSKNMALVGQATFLGLPVYDKASNNVNTGEVFNIDNFQQTVESILNRISFD